MMRKLLCVSILVVTGVLQGCNSTALYDLVNMPLLQNNAADYFPDQQEINQVDKITWITGVENGAAYQKVDNNSNELCKVRVRYADDSVDHYCLDPGETTGSLYMSIDNQAQNIDTLCNVNQCVFEDSF